MTQTSITNMHPSIWKSRLLLMEKKSVMPDEDMNQQAKKKKKKDFEDFTINTRF